MVVKIQLFMVGTYSSEFFMWRWMKSILYKEKVNTTDELVALVMNSAAVIKQGRQDDLMRPTRTVAKKVVKCTEGDGGILEPYFEQLEI